MGRRRSPDRPVLVPAEERGRSVLRVRLDEPAGSFAVPQPIAGRYRVDDLLSAGPESVVLRAVDVRTRQPVVIKALRADGPLGDDHRRRRHWLQTERRLLVRLRNAGCAAVPIPLDYVYDRNPDLDDDFGPYLVLERISGQPLEKWLEKSYPEGVPWEAALRLIRPVVRALAVLHRPWKLASGRTWHCVYQDLKPANLVVERGSGRLRLLDFGGCQVVVDGVPVLEGSRTPGYSAPESEDPRRVLLPCADVYAFGTTLYRMLGGNGPIDHAHPDALPPAVAPGVRDLLRRCLAARPSDRPSDAADLARIIDTLLAP